MAGKKKQEEVKQQETPRKENASGKKTATGKKADKAATNEKESQQGKAPSLADQYKSLKEKNPDAVLLFRKGDFYQAVNEDAKKTSEVLGITLTRPNEKAKGEYLAMFPHQAIDTYLPKLIRAGVRVAIVDDLSLDKGTKASAEVKKGDSTQEGTKREQPVGQAKAVTGKEQKTSSEPQLVTVNGEKVTSAHAFQSNRNPDTWYFTARLDGKQLRPMAMHAADMDAYRKREISIEQLMKTYYPSKMERKVSKEEYAADNKLSDGRVIEKMNVYKETDQSKPDAGRYKLYAVVGEQKMSQTLSFADLNAYFDRTTTPAKLVERTFGEKLHLASAYEKYKLPEGAKVEDIRIAKDRKTNQWNISADMGQLGVTPKKPLQFDDGFSYFTAKTATREQLAAKYLSREIKGLMAGKQQEQGIGLKM